MIGRRFGKLVILRKSVRHGRTLWVCRCDCGKQKPILNYNLKSGASRSCGCVVRTKTDTALPEYTIWANMKGRCLTPTANFYARYGGRGIKVCDRWLKFKNFYVDMGPRPGPGYSLDRYPDRDGNYEPNNVRWATSDQQANNRSNNRIVEYRGRTMTLTEAARMSGTTMNEASIRYRMDDLGWDITKALEHPSRYRTKETAAA